jgi:hypothetical protein
MQSPAVFQMMFQLAHEQLEAVMADVTSEVAHYLPAGVVSSIGAQYIHAVTSEDAIVNAILKQGAPLMATEFAGRIGSTEAPQLFTWGEWGRTVKADVAQAKAYAQGVYASTQAYVATLTPEAVGEMLDLTQMGMGMVPRAGLLYQALQQILIHTGEISTIKGLQGLKGYPA